MPKRVPRVVEVKNKDGTSSSERTISVGVGELNSGRTTLIPTIIEGKQLSNKEAIRWAVQSGLKFPDFDSPKAAGEFARDRSQRGGAVTQGFLGREPKRKGAKVPKQGKKKESNLEFQKRTFPGRLKAVERRSAKILGERGAQGFKKPPSAKERVSAKRARKAAGRIRKRLGIKKKGVSFGNKVGKTVEGLKELFRFGKRVAKAPGAFRGVGQ